MESHVRYLYRVGGLVNIDRASSSTILCKIYTISDPRLCQFIVLSRRECGKVVSVLYFSDGT